MCGIICILNRNKKTDSKDIIDELQIFKGNIVNRGPDWFETRVSSSKTCNLLFSASVLWLQGQSLRKQPLEDDKYMFVYNGDIFGGLQNELISKEGDTSILFKLLHDAENKPIVFSQLQGPYAFILFDKVEEKLYFGRDIYGRRSLLLGTHDEVVVLTSVSKRTKEYNFIELPSIGIFCLSLKTNQLRIYPWSYRNPNFNTKLRELESFLNNKIIVESEVESCDYFKFVEPSSEDLHLYKDIQKVETNMVFEILLQNLLWYDKVVTLKNLLECAIEIRISTQPKYCKDCIRERKVCFHSLVGVLFSGGLDCAILALLADKFVDKDRPIDLINVAFDETNNYQTPDRITGLQTLQELKDLKPEREWNFVEVNIPQQELNHQRSQRVADLIYPLQTILDDSLGCALWFAGRGKSESYQSPCRVLLVGMGADELFGGYTRHRAALKRASWTGLHDTLVQDWQNLPYRNLARDDRVVSDHGRQLRTPYLDENVVQFVCQLNCWEKTYPSHELTQGVGEKILLRSLAYHLGLKNVCTFKKRALQFGSRIANKKENAHDISIRLTS